MSVVASGSFPGGKKKGNLAKAFVAAMAKKMAISQQGESPQKGEPSPEIAGAEGVYSEEELAVKIEAEKVIFDKGTAGNIFDEAFSKHHVKEKAKFLHKLDQSPVPDNIFDDFYNASDAVKKALFAVLEDDPLYVQLVKSTPGIGKTEAMIAVLLFYASNGVMPFYSASTREQVWQVYDRIKSKASGQLQKIINVQGRHGGYIRKIQLQDGSIGEMKVPCTCMRIDAVRRAQAKGYHPQFAVCIGCPFWPMHKNQYGDVTGVANACGYFQGYYKAAETFEKKPKEDKDRPIVLMTHAMAACIVTDSEMIEPEVFCFDEDFTSALRETVTWDEDELQRVIDIAELIPFRRLMRQSVRVAKRFAELSKLSSSHEEIKNLSESERAILQAVNDASFDKDTVTLSGIDLYLVVKRAAYEMGSSLEKILEPASTLPKLIKQGAFNSMTDEQFNRLPHASEPDLAKDMLAVFADAKGAKESAYRISLRKMKDTEWGFCRDLVRRINYGERLIILDAYGEEKIYERVCNREVKTTEVKCKMRDNVTVFHHPERTTRKAMDDFEARLKIYYSRLVPILENSKNKKVLIYTQKRYAEWLQKIIERSNFGMEKLAIKWFWMDHGDDNYGDYDKLIMFGSAYSHVIGDMHLVNAIYEGDETIDFSKLHNHEYADDRVALVKKSRQENEMMQAIFRLRPSKPRKNPQEIHIFSEMKLPLNYEMPGATKKMMYSPDFDREGITGAMNRLYDKLGFFVSGMAPFIYETELLIDWYEAGGTSSGKSLLMVYDEYKARFDLFAKNRFYKVNSSMFGKLKGVTPTWVTFHEKPVRVWGDEKKAINFLEELRKEFYEPGCYNEDPFAEKSDEPADAEAQEEADTQQVSDEVQKNWDKDFDFTDYLNDETFSQDEVSPVYGKYKKAASGSDVDTS